MEEEETKSEVNVRRVGIDYFIDVKDQYTENHLALSREELEKIVLYGQIILKEYGHPT